MTIKSVDAVTLKRWIESGEAVVIDVREPAEHESAKIHGTMLVPLSTLTKSALVCCEGKKLVIHCRSGQRSTSACKKLLAEDPNIEVYNLEGGILAWGAAGQAIITSGKFFLPLDRQVQLAIGFMLIIGSLLGYMVSPIWFLLTGFMGMGLSIAGLTGFCGLAKVMAKMPWNKVTS